MLADCPTELVAIRNALQERSRFPSATRLALLLRAVLLQRTSSRGGRACKRWVIRAHHRLTKWGAASAYDGCLIRYGELGLPRGAVAQLVVALKETGASSLAYRLGRAVDTNADEFRLTPNDYAPILRALAHSPIPDLAEFSRVLEVRSAVRTPTSEEIATLREKRMAANEAFFRELNQRLEEARTPRLGHIDHRVRNPPTRSAQGDLNSRTADCEALRYGPDAVCGRSPTCRPRDRRSDLP